MAGTPTRRDGLARRRLGEDGSPTAGPAAIDRELADKLPLAFEGGYIPTLDHWTPPDVTYDNFMYYWRRKKEMLGM